MGGLALLTAVILDKRLVDPEGFLGPSWLRLPLLVFGALAARHAAAHSSGTREGSTRKCRKKIVIERWHTHWNRERITLVVMGLVCFYITYVSYRNLKSFLPVVMGVKKYDRELHLLDQALFFGHEPALRPARPCSAPASSPTSSRTIYLWFLPLVPLVLTAWLIWSRNISYGYWFATSQCLAWTLGTASYYALPTLGPGFEYSCALPRPRQHRHHPADGLPAIGTRRRAYGWASRARPVGGRLREPALRDHAAGGADGAVHDPVAGSCTGSSGPTS